MIGIPDEEDEYEQERESRKLYLKYINVPVEIIAHPNLRPIDGYIFGLIFMLAGGKRGCFAKNHYFATTLNIHTSTVEESLARLRKFGFIIDNGQMNHKRALWVARGIMETNEHHVNDLYDKMRAPRKTLGAAPRKTLGHNIIFNNSNISKDIYGGSQEEPRSNSFENRRIKRNKEATHQNETTRSRYNNTTPRTRKRTIEVPSVPPAAVSVKTDDFVEYWNGLKGVAPHRNPATQVYKDCAAAIRKLAAGTLFKNKAVDPEWMKKRRIPPKYLSRQLSPAQVRGVLDSLALLYLEGYWPENKKQIKGLGLRGMLYNPRSQISQALAVMVSPPEPLGKQMERWAEDKEDDATKADIGVVLAAVEEAGLPTPYRRDAAQVVDTVWGWWDTWDEEARDRVPRHTNILNWFGDWLKIKARNWPTMPIRVIKKDSDIMQEFVAWVERDCLGGVNVETNGLR